MNKWKHFLVFSLIATGLVFFAHLIGRDANLGDKLMQILDVIAILEVPILITILILTYNNKERLSVSYKILFLLGIELVFLMSSIIINVINPFGRRIYLEDIYKGAFTGVILYGVLFILSLPIAIFLDSKLDTKE